MGYHVTILRTSGSRAVPITMKEIEEFARNSPDWKYDANQQALLSREQDEPLALWFSDGELWTKNPSEESIGRMLSIADQFGARVRGDELETYRTPREAYLHPDDAPAKAQSEAEVNAIIRRTRRNSIVLHALIFGGFMTLIFILRHFGLLE